MEPILQKLTQCHATKVAKLFYSEEYPFIYVQSHGHYDRKRVIETGNAILYKMELFQCGKIIYDNRLGIGDISAYFRLIWNEFLPKAYKLGYSHNAIIRSKDDLMDLSSLDFLKEIENDGVQRQYFTSPESAIDWILKFK